MNQKHYQYFTDDTGRQLVRIAVDTKGTTAVTEAALWDNAVKRNGLKWRPYFNSKSDQCRYVLAAVENGTTHRTLARLLLDCPKAYKVQCIDGDRLNLRPDNFRLKAASWADPETCERALEILIENARKPVEVTHAPE